MNPSPFLPFFLPLWSSQARRNRLGCSDKDDNDDRGEGKGGGGRKEEKKSGKAAATNGSLEDGLTPSSASLWMWKRGKNWRELPICLGCGLDTTTE